MMDSRALLDFDKDMSNLALDLSANGAMRWPLQVIGHQVMTESIGKNFKGGGRPRKWASVSSDMPYRKSHGSGSPLWVTGKMKRAASAKARWNVKDNRLTYGYFPSTLWFAVVHDDAKMSDRAGIANRPFALFQADDIRDAEKILMDWYEFMVNQNIKLFYTGRGV